MYQLLPIPAHATIKLRKWQTLSEGAAAAGEATGDRSPTARP